MGSKQDWGKLSSNKFYILSANLFAKSLLYSNA